MIYVADGTTSTLIEVKYYRANHFVFLHRVRVTKKYYAGEVGWVMLTSVGRG